MYSKFRYGIYFQKCLFIKNIVLNKGLLSEVLLAHIHPLMLEERLPVVEEKINLIITD